MLNDCLTGGPCQFCGGPWVLSVQQGRRFCRTERTHRSAELTRPTVNHLTNDQQRWPTCTDMFAHVHTSSHMFRTCSHIFTYLHTYSRVFRHAHTCAHVYTCSHMLHKSALPVPTLRQVVFAHFHTFRVDMFTNVAKTMHPFPRVFATCVSVSNLIF